MSEYIQRNIKLLVVSDTGIVLDKDGNYKAFGPVVKELKNLLDVFDEITWIGFNRKKQINNKSYVKISDNRIKVVLLEEVGGNTIFDKIKIIISYPKMFSIINKLIIKHKYIHSRAPSNPSIIVMFLSLLYLDKVFWHKYAGSWIDHASFFYKLQRFILSKLRSNSVVSINGKFSNKKNIISFENPCLDEKDRKLGKLILKSKKLRDKVNFCFVGGLNSKKGVDDILNAFKNISSKKIGEIHFVGNSELKDYYMKLSEEISYKTVFHGFLAKDEIKKIYKISNFILLPSKSEGFPKVIGEGMNFGAIPIVSNISCINEYINTNKNGYLIEKPISENLINVIKECLSLDEKIYLDWVDSNYKIAEKFTYSYYNYRVKNEIFKIN
ncbi:glycosyltransferase family 4 protein [Polaribacter haliotis]|uniref:Glycosyltransferase family 4 protein n=1 Tax=Polaribacter haliotis TaxID=1888915 RepID=A0A7L8AHN7_9FLAO|nr:glycosyltransferase [Polaribacter haliotis]QOD61507.1 glycosyltransferase family 4 protein [Polaribacter haliotis]